jgi:anti-sigma-K factor RskA
MQLQNHPELLDRIAAAYALGTLRGGARRRFESIARQSPTARAAALLWHERLIVMTELQTAQVPSANVWKRIENMLDRPAPAVAAPARPRAGWWQAAFAGSALAAVVAAVISLDQGRDLDAQASQLAQLRSESLQLARANTDLRAQMAAQPDIRYVSVLHDDKAAPTMLVTYDPKHNTLTLKRVGGFQEGPDKSLQLWAVGGAPAPQSLGVLGGEAVIRLPAREQQVQQVPVLAVSLEPKGGVPGEGGPTGPVLFKGALLQTPL